MTEKINNCKILVIGASGFIGRYLFSYLKSLNLTVYGTYFQHRLFENLEHLNISKEQEVAQLLNRIRPHVIIHCSALTSVQQCEAEQEAARVLNTDAPLYIARYCREYGARMIFLSTDLVFSGRNPPYTENSRTDPLNYYGYTKAKAEEELIRFPRVTIVRTSLNYGIESHFLQWVMSRLKGEGEVPLFQDEYRNAIYAADFARVLYPLIQENPRHKIYHVAASNSLNRYDWGLYLFRQCGLEKWIPALKKAEGSTFSASRPRDVSFDISLLESEFDLQCPSAEESIQTFIMREGSLFTSNIQGDNHESRDNK